MPNLSSYVLDSYDDIDGRILKSVASDVSFLPSYIKTASFMTEEQIERLPDDQFALVLFDGTQKLKKYATIDAGNTAISAVYLLKQAHLLPSDAVKTAAKNLIGACEYHNIPVSYELKVAAETGISPVSGKSQTPYARNAKVNKIQWPMIADRESEFQNNPRLGNHDAGVDDVDQRTNYQGTPGTNYMELPAFPQKEKMKVAAYSSSGAEIITRQKQWRESPYYDASNWDPSFAFTEEPPIPEKTLLDDKYPVDSFSQVKTASIYFQENWQDFGPRDRHRYCVKLAQRLEELGIPITEKIARYGSSTYASDVDAYVEHRRSYVGEDLQEGIDLLLEKRAQVSPETFAEALEEFDKIAGLNWHWNHHIADPWYSTFGPSMQKIAEEEWRWDRDGTRISEDDLKNLAVNGHERLCKSFGSSFAKEFCKNPKVVFNSLPDPNKLIVARMASDRHSGTVTE